MIWLWVGFIVFVLLMLTLDLGVFHRKAHVDTRERGPRVVSVWITLGLSFSVFVYFGYEGHWLGLGIAPDPIDGVVNDGWTAMQKYLTGYVVEESLSVDNIFVIAMMFGFFAVPPLYQHRVLFWGILGALVMRGVMIAVGATADRGVPLDPVPLRRLPDPHGHQDAVPEDGAQGPEPEHPGAAGAALVSRHRPVPRGALPRAGRDAGLPRERATRCGRPSRMRSWTGPSRARCC